MTTIKTPQTVSHKNNNSQNGHGFITFLLLMTWLAIGALFYGIKIGIIKSEEVNPAVSAKLSELESNLTAVDNRLKFLEKKLSDASSALNPAAQPTETSPESLVKPEEARPESPAKPEEAKKPEGGVIATPPAAPADPIMPEPESTTKQPEDKSGAAPTKPQTNNKDKSGATDQTAISEKKNYI